MKKFLIIKTGGTPPFIRQQFGDFEDMVVEQAGISQNEVSVFPVYLEKTLPAVTDFAGVIITGSSSMVTEELDWSLWLESWLRENAFRSVPVLGICFGHQMIAKAFGGKVDYHPQGMELGTVSIELTREGLRDPLLNVLPARFPAHMSHSQSALVLPGNTRVLARNSFEPHQAFCIGKSVWGIQFHPEFTADIMHGYIKSGKEKLEHDGLNTAAIEKSVMDNPYGKLLLHRFIELAGKS